MRVKQLVSDNYENYQKWKESFFGKIEQWYLNIIGYKIDEFIYGCKNIIKWFPTIWKDRDWSHNHILIILKQKLYFTAKLHIQNQRYVGWEREVELMTLCIKLIDFVEKEHYEDVGYDWMEQKYGKSHFKFIPIEGSDMSTLEIEHDNILSGQYTEEQYYQDWKRTHDEAALKHNKARRLLFNILDSHIERWWD